MGNLGHLRLTVKDAEGHPFRGELFIRIENDREVPVYAQRKLYHVPILFTNLDAAPSGLHRLHIKGRSHCPMSSFVQIESDRETARELFLVIDPEIADAGGAGITFPTLGALAGLEGVFTRPFSAQIASTPEWPVPRGSQEGDGLAYFNAMAGNRTLDFNHRRLACLFNLHRKLAATSIDGTQFAWDLIDSVFRVEQDRLFAQVKPVGIDAVFAALQARWEERPAKEHNIPQPPGFTKMRSFKSTRGDDGDKRANLQLVFSSRTDAGDTTWIVDADIDESTGIGHVGDAVVHFLSGAKTNPYFVHQLMSRAGLKPSYDLVFA